MIGGNRLHSALYLSQKSQLYSQDWYLDFLYLFLEM